MQSEEPRNDNDLEEQGAAEAAWHQGPEGQSAKSGAASEFLYGRGWGHDRFALRWWKVAEPEKTFLMSEILLQETILASNERHTAAEPAT